MKIIKEGKLPNKPVYTGKCVCCGCEIEAYEEETRREVKDVTWVLPVDIYDIYDVGNITTIVYAPQRYVDCPTKGCYGRIQVYPKLQRSINAEE